MLSNTTKVKFSLCSSLKWIWIRCQARLVSDQEILRKYFIWISEVGHRSENIVVEIRRIFAQDFRCWSMRIRWTMSTGVDWLTFMIDGFAYLEERFEEMIRCLSKQTNSHQNAQNHPLIELTSDEIPLLSLRHSTWEAMFSNQMPSKGQKRLFDHCSIEDKAQWSEWISTDIRYQLISKGLLVYLLLSSSSFNKGFIFFSRTSHILADIYSLITHTHVPSLLFSLFPLTDHEQWLKQSQPIARPFLDSSKDLRGR